MNKNALTISILVLLLALGASCSMAAGFEENHGQLSGEYRFLVRDVGYALGLGTDRIEIRPSGADSTSSLFLEFSGGNRDLVLRGQTLLPGKVNYLAGLNPDDWITAVPTWSSVRYGSIYEGIDLVVGGKTGDLYMEFELAPGVNYEDLLIGIHTLLPMELNGQGELRIGNAMRLLAPEINQQTDEGPVPLDGGYLLLDGLRLAVEPARRDIDLPMTIRIGVAGVISTSGPRGSGNEPDLAVGADGDLIVTGQTMPYGSGGAYVTRLTDHEATVSFTTFYGNSGEFLPAAVAVDSEGQAVVVGWTRFGDEADAFVLGLSADGSRRIHSTLLGGPGEDHARDVLIGPDGSVWVTGETAGGLPMAGDPLDAEAAGGSEAWLAHLSSDGSELLFSTYLGGSGRESGEALALDREGNILVAGTTWSSDFPLLDALQPELGSADSDMFLAKLTPFGELLYSTYIGGPGSEQAWDLAVDQAGAAYLSGRRSGITVPSDSTRGTFNEGIGRRQRALPAAGVDAGDAFVLKVDPEGTAVVWSAPIGGSGDERGRAITLDDNGRIWIAGVTGSADFPVVDARQPFRNGEDDAFLSTLSPDGTRLLRSTYLGGSGSDFTSAIGTDGEDVLVLGQSSGTELPGGQVVGSDATGQSVFISRVGSNDAAILAAGCPGTINFDNDAGNGLWQEQTNWDTDMLPTSTDDVCIDGFAVTLPSGLQNAGTLYVSATGSLTVNGGTLTLASASEIHGSFAMGSGTVNGTGALTVNGVFDWTGGFFDGSGQLLATNTLNISGTSVKSIGGRTLRNSSSLNWSGTGQIYHYPDSAFINDGTWVVTNDVWMRNVSGGGAGFTNNGTFQKTAGSGTTRISMPFHNAGAVDIQTGTLRLDNGGVASGSFGGAGVLYLRMGAQDLYDLQASSSLAVSAFSVYGGTANISGEYDVSGVLNQSFGATNFSPGAVITTIGGVVAINAGAVNFATGNAVTLPTLKLGDPTWSQGGKLGGSDAVTVTGAFDWGQGAQISTSGGILAEGTVSMTGGLGVSLTDCEFRNTSVVNWSARAVTLNGSSMIVNDGTWEVTSDDSVISRAIGSSFINNGTFRKTVGTGTTFVNTPFENNGIVEIQTGTVLMDGAATGSSTTGSFVGPGSIVFDGPTHELLSGSLLQVSQVKVGSPTNIAGEYDVPGTLTVESTLTFQNGAVVTNMGDLVTRSTVAFETGSPFSLNAVTMTGGQLGGSDALTINGMFEWSGGALSTTGGVLATSTVNMTGTARHTVYNGTFRNTGTVNLSGTGSAELLNGGAFVNDGTWEITNDAWVFTPNLNSHSFTNNGTFRKSGTSGVTRVSTIFNNYGAVEILAGSIDSTSGYTQYSGSTILDGGSLSLTISSSFSTADIQGGVLGGYGTLTGGVYNAGSVAPGLSAGLLNVGREYTTYTQSATGSLDIELGGLTAGTEHDQLSVSTDAVLDGTLNVTLINGYVPVEGDSFTILEATTVTGTFATVNTPVLPGGTPWRVIYNATSVVLAVGDTCADVDSDGYAICDGNCTLDPADVCGDCDDGDAAIHPGATELTCDGIDQNCNGAADDTPDGDGDGSSVCDDCDDADSGIYPGATEVTCDGIDQNCNGAGDDTPDADGDGYDACGTDCNDSNAAIHPGATEIACDGVDQNCNGAADDTPDTDADGDGYNICDECNDSDAAINPGAAEIACDGIDQNCNGLSDDGPDSDGDGYSECVDCDDANNAVNPGADEITCDEIDQNCNGLADDAPDADDDGYSECVDCDDSDETVNPGATEVCDDEADNDCDGLTDGADYADCGMGGPRTICAALGDDGSDPDVDKDVFVFTASAGEQVTLNLEPVNAPSLPGRAALILVDATSGEAELVGSDRTALPNQLVATLLTAGEYHIGVYEEPGISFLSGRRFAGTYCLTIDSTLNAAQSLEPTSSVEGVESRSTDIEPPSEAPRLDRTRSSESTPRLIRRR